jgi:hypothetical protein
MLFSFRKKRLNAKERTVPVPSARYRVLAPGASYRLIDVMPDGRALFELAVDCIAAEGWTDFHDA